MTKTRRICVRGIIFKNGKLLCQQLRPDGNGLVRTHYWCTPGGGLEAHESLHEGLHRELIEETSITPRIGKLLFIQQYENETKEFLEFFFHIQNPESYETIDLSMTSHGDLEIENVEFISPKEHNILPAFLQTIDIQGYIDGNLPVFITYELS